MVLPNTACPPGVVDSSFSSLRTYSACGQERVGVQTSMLACPGLSGNVAAAEAVATLAVLTGEGSGERRARLISRSRSLRKAG